MRLNILFLAISISFIFVGYAYSVGISIRAMGHGLINYGGDHVLTDDSIPASEYNTPYSSFEADENYSFSGGSFYLTFRHDLGIGGSNSTLMVTDNLNYKDQSLTVKKLTKTVLQN